MKVLPNLSDPRCGTEPSCNALRMAKAVGRQRVEIALFLMVDAMTSA